MKHCEECLAHYTEGYDHVCPEWMVLLVRRMRARNEEVERLNREEGGQHCAGCLRRMVEHGPHEFSCPCTPGLRLMVG